ncbi:hypothetical protein DV738_g1115, partial [Chaetothyriales sp. CBS 135597]
MVEWLSICERIKVNGKPISEREFATNFFQAWNKLPKTATPALDIPPVPSAPPPLLAFHIFIKAGVNAFVCEAHMGGHYDATNIFDSPVLFVRGLKRHWSILS